MKALRGVSCCAMAMTMACAPTQTTSRASLIGTNDLVLVDQLGSDGRLAAKTTNDDGSLSLMGLPNRYVFVTSSDTNELRVLETFRSSLVGRSFLRAPNPLQVLSIPVLDRPTMLAVDEGRNAQGARVTGSYVYAARPGGSEVSVVSIDRRRQLGGKPIPTPGPVTAIGAFMNVLGTVPLETPIPAQTRLFVATWDGAFAAVYSADIATNSPDIDRLDFRRLLYSESTPIVAVLPVVPLLGRTVDGVPFCATSVCLALASRSASGGAGQSILLDPETGRAVPLSFGAPVRKLVNSQDPTRIYGILDEEVCGSTQCGGVVSVTVTAGTGTAGFPLALNAIGQPMSPIRGSGGLITGLTVSTRGALRQTREVADGGSLEFVMEEYGELGALATSDGQLTFFDGLTGSMLDFDAQRSTLSAVSVRIPGALADGGTSFTGDDGGLQENIMPLSFTVDGPVSQPFRTITAGGWVVDISDGYFETQVITATNRGPIPGLSKLPTSASAGLSLSIPVGFETRVALGDVVAFETGTDSTGFFECGRSPVLVVRAGTIEVPDVPLACAGRTRFSVLSLGLKTVVIEGEFEGYMGRWDPGQTMTYSRPLVLIPAGVTSSRTALSITIPSAMPTGEGAQVSFAVEGHLSPFRLGLDVANIGCYDDSRQLPAQVVLGALGMAQVPSTVAGKKAMVWRWTVFGGVPSGNGLAEVSLEQTRVGSLGLVDGAICWR